MNSENSIPAIKAEWLNSPTLQTLFDAMEMNGEETRVNGGAVRNSIMNEPVADIDLATTIVPNRVTEILKNAGIKVIPTGIDHGTVTAIIDKQAFEITTLRRDIETDGRHAIVHFGRNWVEDAMRRDLTMNALYCDRHGVIYDPLDGYEDVMARNVRFIGDADQRIEEDYLRILRFFRFFAQYGSGRPDAEGLKACTRLKEGINSLSVERVWQELKKILGARDPSKAILWMRTTGVLNLALPESEKWGIDFFGDYLAAEQEFDWEGDALSRLKSIVPPMPQKMKKLAKRLKFSSVERDGIISWASAELPNAELDEDALTKFLYRQDQAGVIDRLKGEIVRLRFVAREDDQALLKAGKFVELLAAAQNWVRPEFPVKGRDIQSLGIKTGPKIGKIMKRLEGKWVDSCFKLSKSQLLAQV